MKLRRRSRRRSLAYEALLTILVFLQESSVFICPFVSLSRRKPSGIFRRLVALLERRLLRHAPVTLPYRPRLGRRPWLKRNRIVGIEFCLALDSDTDTDGVEQIVLRTILSQYVCITVCMYHSMYVSNYACL